MDQDLMTQARTQAKEIATRITIDPDVMAGKPVIKGTRMPVELILAKLSVNPDLEEFFLDYPELTLDDIKAALAYASKLVVQQEKAEALP
jgi:uncharacterized protein (DUF433 family)